MEPKSPKRNDLEELARDTAQLKGNEKGTERPTLAKQNEFVYDESKPLDGIIAHLTREYGGNVHRKGIVHVMGTGKGQKFAVELEDTKHEYYSDCEMSWICYDFNEKRVIPTSYSLRSSAESHGSRHLKSWVIEVSNDGYSWTEIDHRENNNDLNGEYALCNFKISSVPTESFRFFRLRQTGKSHHGSYAVAITALEIFGTLVVKEKIQQPRPLKHEFVYHADREGKLPPPLFTPKLDGIIAHLTLECGGNVDDKGVVNVRASSYSGISSSRDVVDLETDSHFVSNCRDNSWICYDFKEKRVIPTSYSVRTYNWSPRGDHLKSWVIEVSNDASQKSWRQIDCRYNTNDLNYWRATVNFSVLQVPSEGFRFFRLRQIGMNHNRRDQLTIAALEIFGTLFEN